MLHFESQILKEFYIDRGVRRVINSTEEFSGTVTVKSKPDGRKFRRCKGMGTRVSYVVGYLDATASFRSKMRIEKIRGNRVGASVHSLRQLGLS